MKSHFKKLKVMLLLMPIQEKRTNLKKPNSDRTGHGFRVKFNPLALLLDASLEGEFDLVQRIIYEVCCKCEKKVCFIYSGMVKS